MQGYSLQIKHSLIARLKLSIPKNKIIFLILYWIFDLKRKYYFIYCQQNLLYLVYTGQYPQDLFIARVCLRCATEPHMIIVTADSPQLTVLEILANSLQFNAGFYVASINVIMIL